MTDILLQAQEAHRAGRLDEAERHYRAILAGEPRNAEVLRLMGALMAQRRNYAEAEKFVMGALALAPQDASSHFNLALICLNTGRPKEALVSSEHALVLNPAHGSARMVRGRALTELDRAAEAVGEFDRLLLQIPADAGAYYWRGVALAALMRPAQALDSFGRALALKRDGPALVGCAVMLQALNRSEEAIAFFKEALALEPEHAALQSGLADTLLAAGHYADAIAAYDKAYALDSTLPFVPGNTRFAKLKIGDWSNYEADRDLILDGLRHGLATASTLVTVESDSAQQQICARLHAARKFPVPLAPLWQGERYDHPRIRLAYVSKDLRDHATATLGAELFERHDRNRFEVFAISVGPDDKSAERKRLEAAFEHFHDLQQVNDAGVAQFLRRQEIDIAIDLDGYTVNARPRIFAYRPSPISVSFMGYPGTLGAKHMDYIIADRIVLPEADQPFFDERVTYLPHSYQPNTRRQISSKPLGRAEMGLAEDAFVFCCFNGSLKITPPLFDIWMRLLKKVEGSVLWLLGSDPVLQANLRREAQARGVDGARLVFAGRLNHQEHLARHKLADLFLDTLPFNAHTTASDALWAGLPVLTCTGNTFPGRVAASLLTAIGLPELITSTLEDYESLALELAQNPARLWGLRQRLWQNRETCPLYDGAAYTRDIETAYRAMWERHQAGQAPTSFDV